MCGWVILITSEAHVPLSILWHFREKNGYFFCWLAVFWLATLAHKGLPRWFWRPSNHHSEERCRGSRLDFFHISLLLPECLVLPLISALFTELFQQSTVGPQNWCNLYTVLRRYRKNWWIIEVWLLKWVMWKYWIWPLHFWSKGHWRKQKPLHSYGVVCWYLKEQDFSQLNRIFQGHFFLWYKIIWKLDSDL